MVLILMFYLILLKIINFPLFVYYLIYNVFNINISNIRYNTNIGSENLNREYKLFTFIHNIPLDIEEAKYYCKSNKLLPDFNNYVLLNLYIYIKIFLQKNIYAFLNTNINGHFYIGVDDNGNIKGIPYNGIFPIKFLYLYIHFILYFYSNNNDVYKYIKINFIKISVNKISIEKIHNEFKKYIKDEKYYINILNNYKKSYNEWLYNYKNITRKLVDLANDKESREKIIDYIKNNNNNNYNKVLDIFYSSYTFENIKGNEIKTIKNDETNGYSWIMKWKDYECDKLLHKKPIKPSCLKYYDKIKSIPFRLINCLELNLFWLKNNKNMDLYVINITIKKHNSNEKYLYFNKLPIRSTNINGTPYVKFKV